MRDEPEFRHLGSHFRFSPPTTSYDEAVGLACKLAALPNNPPRMLLLRALASDMARLLTATVLGLLWLSPLTLSPTIVGQVIDGAARDGSSASVIRGLIVLGSLTAASLTAGVFFHRALVTLELGAMARLGLATLVASMRGIDAESDEIAAFVTAQQRDVVRVSQFVAAVPDALSACILWLACLVLMAHQSLLVALALLVGFPLALILPSLGLQALLRAQHRDGIAQTEVTAQQSDLLLGLRVLRGTGGEAAMLRRFRARASTAFSTSVDEGCQSARIDAVALVARSAFLIGVAAVAALELHAGRLTPGEFIASVAYSTFILQPLATTVAFFDKLSRGIESAQRLSKFIAPSLSKPGLPPDGRPSPQLTDQILGVAFQPGALTVVAFSDSQAEDAFAARVRGKASGALLGTAPLEQLGAEQRGKWLLVTEPVPRLLAGTLRDTLTLDGALKAATAHKALSVVRGKDILTGSADAWSRWIAEWGSNLSGGQRARLGIARAIAAEPPVLVCLAPSRGLDSVTVRLVAEQIRMARRGLTTVVVSRSPAFLRAADVVFLVEHNGLVVRGPYDKVRQRPQWETLIRNRGLQRDLVADDD